MTFLFVALIFIIKNVSPLMYGKEVNLLDPQVRHFTTAFFRVNGTASTFLCQGHIINTTFIITTARCGKKLLKPHKDGGAVYITEYGSDLSIIGKPEKLLNYNNQIKKVIFNPMTYELETLNDIAFIITTKSINYCQNMNTFHPILIMTSDHFKQMSRDYYLLGHDEFQRESKCFIRSWGRDETNKFNMKLHEIPVHLLETTEHYILLESEITGNDGFICWGDVGASVFCEIEEAIYIYGIVSFSDEILKRSPKDCRKLKVSKIPFLHSKHNRDFIDSLFYNHTLELDLIFGDCDTSYRSRFKKHKIKHYMKKTRKSHHI